LDNRNEVLAEGIAMSLALDSPTVAPGSTFAISGGIGHYDNAESIAVGASYRYSDKMLWSGGLGVGVDHGKVGARVGVSYSW
jgi:opacity protein-like surface antigen